MYLKREASERPSLTRAVMGSSAAGRSSRAIPAPARNSTAGPPSSAPAASGAPSPTSSSSPGTPWPAPARPTTAGDKDSGKALVRRVLNTFCWCLCPQSAELGGMSVHLFEGSIAGPPPEPLVLEEVAVRLIEDTERGRYDEELGRASCRERV